MAITDIVALPFGDPFGHFATDETSEQWLAQVTVDLDDYDNARFAAAFGATIRAASGAIPTFKIYMYNASMGAMPPVCILFITPMTTPSDWTAALVSTTRVVGRGPTTFSLYGVSSAPPCVYYPRGAGGVAPTLLSRTANPSADTFTVALTTSNAMLFSWPSSSALDPGLSVIPRGTYTFKIWGYSTGNPCSIEVALYTGDSTILANYGAYQAFAVGSALVEHVFTYTQTSDKTVSPGFLQWHAWGHTSTGTGNLVIGIGGSYASSITVPWPGVTGVSEINAASLTLEFGDVDPAPRRPPPGPVGGDDIWLGEVD